MIKYLRNIKDYFLLKQSSLFDEAYYCLQYPDVRQADVDPLWHFTSFGWKEGRNPSAVFDTKFYLKNNPDVYTLKINPLSHYIKYGKKEGRLPNANRHDTLSETIDLALTNNGKSIALEINEINDGDSYKTLLSSIYNPSIAKISICVLCNNHENSIADCLEGILTQKGCFHLELVIADDCSTDKTIEVIKPYLVRFGRKGVDVKFLTGEKNIGPYKNLERCLKSCSGDFLATCDGNDYWIDPLKLSKQMEFLFKHPLCSFCFHDILIFNQNSQKYSPHPSQQRLNKNILTTKDLILDYSIGNASCCMYNAKFMQNMPNNYSDFDDWKFNIYFSQFGQTGHLNEIMSVNRQTNQGMWSGLSSTEQIEGWLQEIDRFNNYLEFKYNSEFEQLKRQLNLNFTLMKHSQEDEDINGNDIQTPNILLSEEQLREVELIRSSRLFNAEYYLKNNPDVKKAKVDPAAHYLLQGGFEGRDPSDEFSSLEYLKMYKDVRLANTNPLVHYLKFGKNEKRQAIDFDHIFIDKIISKSEKFSKIVRPDKITLNKYKKILKRWDYKEFQLVQIDEKLWVLKPNLHFSNVQRELLGYSLGKDIVNLAEIKPISFNTFNCLLNLDLLPPGASPTNTLLSRFVEDYSLDELPLKTLDIAMAGEFVFSLWIRRRDAGPYNRGYVDEIPVFFDYQASLDFEDWLFDIDKFFQPTSPGYAGSWRVTENNGTILTTYESRMRHDQGNYLDFIGSNENFNQAIDQIMNEILFQKININLKVKEAGFSGEKADELSDFLKQTRKDLPRDIGRLKEILFTKSYP
jgi:glycosyltransferase involved in cell wall biosynthesis